MNKKGFTLIELISIIVILSLVITVAATSGFGLFNKAKEKITEENIKVIKDAVNILLIDVENCDEELDSELINEFVDDDPKTCDKLKEKFNSNEELYIPLNYLIKNEYVNGSGVENLNTNNNAKIKICNGEFKSIIN